MFFYQRRNQRWFYAKVADVSKNCDKITRRADWAKAQVHVCLLAHAPKGVATDRWEDFGDLIIEGANSPEG